MDKDKFSCKNNLGKRKEGEFEIQNNHSNSSTASRSTENIQGDTEEETDCSCSYVKTHRVKVWKRRQTRLKCSLCDHSSMNNAFETPSRNRPGIESGSISHMSGASEDRCLDSSAKRSPIKPQDSSKPLSSLVSFIKDSFQSISIMDPLDDQQNPPHSSDTNASNNFKGLAVCESKRFPDPTSTDNVSADSSNKAAIVSQNTRSDYPKAVHDQSNPTRCTGINVGASTSSVQDLTCNDAAKETGCNKAKTKNEIKQLKLKFKAFRYKEMRRKTKLEARRGMLELLEEALGHQYTKENVSSKFQQESSESSSKPQQETFIPKKRENSHSGEFDESKNKSKRQKQGYLQGKRPKIHIPVYLRRCKRRRSDSSESLSPCTSALNIGNLREIGFTPSDDDYF